MVKVTVLYLLQEFRSTGLHISSYNLDYYWPTG